MTQGGMTRLDQVLQILVTEGLDTKEIALRLGITRRTAGNYITKLLEKYEVNSRTKLIAKWYSVPQTEVVCRR